ncbi:hypothetical protein, partial [Streptomyces sp. MB09-02B]|uniref:hypothetical protein n=1 Tax=Streptomyces sp. MB09-02B TaxID=3028667 RepID=UPI0029B1069F
MEKYPLQAHPDGRLDKSAYHGFLDPFSSASQPGRRLHLGVAATASSPEPGERPPERRAVAETRTGHPPSPRA